MMQTWVRTGKQGPLIPAGETGILVGTLFGRKKSSIYPPLEQDILLDDTCDLHEYGIRREIISTPGHTRESVSLLLGNGDAIVGELLFPAFPTGKPGLPFWAEDIPQIMDSIRKVLVFQKGMIYTGHGGPFTAEQVRRRMLQNSRGIIPSN